MIRAGYDVYPREVEEDDVGSWAKERVAAYKYPRIVTLVPKLPKTPTGKNLKRAIDRTVQYQVTCYSHGDGHERA